MTLDWAHVLPLVAFLVGAWRAFASGPDAGGEDGAWW